MRDYPMNLKSSKKGKHSKLAKLKTSFEMHRALISQKCQNIPGPRNLGSPHGSAREVCSDAKSAQTYLLKTIFIFCEPAAGAEPGGRWRLRRSERIYYDRERDSRALGRGESSLIGTTYTA